MRKWCRRMHGRSRPSSDLLDGREVEIEWGEGALAKSVARFAEIVAGSMLFVLLAQSNQWTRRRVCHGLVEIDVKRRSDCAARGIDAIGGAAHLCIHERVAVVLHLMLCHGVLSLLDEGKPRDRRRGGLVELDDQCKTFLSSSPRSSSHTLKLTFAGRSVLPARMDYLSKPKPG